MTNSKRGGARKGAGRPNQGKVRFNGTFTTTVIEFYSALGRGNFSRGVEMAFKVLTAKVK